MNAIFNNPLTKIFSQGVKVLKQFCPCFQKGEIFEEIEKIIFNNPLMFF